MSGKELIVPNGEGEELPPDGSLWNQNLVAAWMATDITAGQSLFRRVTLAGEEHPFLASSLEIGLEIPALVDRFGRPLSELAVKIGEHIDAGWGNVVDATVSQEASVPGTMLEDVGTRVAWVVVHPMLGLPRILSGQRVSAMGAEFQIGDLQFGIELTTDPDNARELIPTTVDHSQELSYPGKLPLLSYNTLSQNPLRLLGLRVEY